MTGTEPTQAAPLAHVCDVDALWEGLDSDVLWKVEHCHVCDARWVYNRNPGAAEGRWYTWAEWAQVNGSTKQAEASSVETTTQPKAELQ